MDIAERPYWPKEWPEWPKDRKARKAVASSFELGLWILNSPAAHRKSLAQQAYQRGQEFWRQMTTGQQERVRELVDNWEHYSTIMQSIRYEETRKGVGQVNHLLPIWHSAEDEVRRVEERVLQLGHVEWQCFQSRVNGFRISLMDYDEFGQYGNYPDHSEVREQWYSRKPITGPLPWPWEKMLLLCKRFEDGELETKETSKWTEPGFILTVVLGVAGIAVPLFMGFR